MEHEQLTSKLLNFLHKKPKINVNDYYASLISTSQNISHKLPIWGIKAI